MKVVQYYPGALKETGPGQSVTGWCAALAGAGADVRLLVEDGPARRPPPANVEVVPIRHALRGRVRIPLALEQHLRDADVLVLHGGWSPNVLVAAAGAHRRGIPYVSTAHAVYARHVILERKPLLKRAWTVAFERPLLRRALAVHLFFAEEEPELALLGVRPRTIVAPNGIDPPPDVRWDGGSGGYVAWVGRFAPEHKGLDLLLRGLKLVPPAERPELRLHGPDWRSQKRRVADLVRALELDDWVRIGDPVYGDDKWRLLASAAGFVHPSRWEGCSMAVLEALAVGVPTMVTPFAMGSFLGAKGAALLAGSTTEGIAEGLRRLSGPRAADVGRRGAEVARDCFSWPALAESWLARVSTLLGETVDRPSDGSRGPRVP